MRYQINTLFFSSASIHYKQKQIDYDFFSMKDLRIQDREDKMSINRALILDIDGFQNTPNDKVMTS